MQQRPLNQQPLTSNPPKVEFSRLTPSQIITPPESGGVIFADEIGPGNPKKRSREPFYRKAAKSAKDLQQKQDSFVW
jgi:hypothetical protein